MRSAPTSAAISGSLTPFCSETTKPSAARRGAIAAEGVLGVLRLDGEQHGAEPVGQLVGRDRPCLDRELLDRALDAQAVGVDRRDVVGVGVAEEHALAARRSWAPTVPPIAPAPTTT